jgi:hypothetical protein
VLSRDEQLRALDREAAMQQAPTTNVDRSDSGGQVSRRRNVVRFGVASALAVVLVGGGMYAAEQIATGTDPEPAQPPATATPQELFTDNLNLEPGTYRMLVGADATGVEIVADLTFYGPGWISGPYPTVVAHNGVHEHTARGGVAVYPPEALASGSGCTNEATKAPANTSQALAEQLAELPRSTVLQAPTPVQAFGHDALHLRLRIDRQCPAGKAVCRVGGRGGCATYVVAETPRGSHGITYGHNPVDIDFWVMDLNGTPVVVDGWYPDGSSGELVERVDETRKSITLVPSK